MGAGGVPQQPDPPASCQAKGPAEGGRMWALAGRRRELGLSLRRQRAQRGRREGERERSGGGNSLPQTLGARARCGGVGSPPSLLAWGP